MRADRLVAALLFMQARGRVTAAQLAAELGISVATARRDLEALSAAGVPVYPQPGRGGGWSLVGGARTDLTGLTRAEAEALFLLAGPAAPTSPAVTSALRKLIRALPGPFRAEAEAAAEAVHVDPARWGESTLDRPELVPALQAAVVRRRKVRLTYRNRAGQESQRLVDALGLVAKDEIWYLVAGTGDGERTFRVDRISAATVTDDPAERPPNFRLEAAWDRVVKEVEQRRSLVSATVLVDRRFAWALREQFGRHAEDAGEADDGRVRVRVAAPTPLMVAQPLAGWGDLVEVVEPESVRTELARLGSELVDRYSR